MKLFVYGTLKRGYGNNVLLAGAKFLGEAATKKSYHLVNCGFPKASTIAHEEQLLPILGEVFEIDEDHLRRCDRLEGHPEWYTRTNIFVSLNGRDEEVMIYEYNHPVEHPSCLVRNNMYYWGRD